VKRKGFAARRGPEKCGAKLRLDEQEPDKRLLRPDEWAAGEGCTLELTDVAKPQVEAARLDKGFVRKRKARARVYDGTCPSTEELPCHSKGHIDTKEPETEKEQKEAAIVVSQTSLGRRSRSRWPENRRPTS